MVVDSSTYPYSCLNAGPLMSSARGAVEAARRLGKSKDATALRAHAVPYVFDTMEQVFSSDMSPAPALVSMLDRMATGFVERFHGQELRDPGGAAAEGTVIKGVAQVTGEHYGRLFREFSSTSFWDEPVRLLRQRLERNNVEPHRWEGKRVLDAGCGGGRYTVAWRLLGAVGAVGLDVSTIGVHDARERVARASIDGVEFQHGNVLELPFANDSFEVVFSNGVLHHTVDWRTGIRELVRVLRPGGLGWLYVIEDPGGFFWDVIEILRTIMAGEDRDDVRQVLAASGVPANRIFYMLDHVMVPINERLRQSDVENALAAAGATDVRRLRRGADFDRVEAIHRGDAFANEKYGVGENRYVFTKA